MPVTRRVVLEHLARLSDAECRETTTTESLVSALDADEAAVRDHIEALVSCELAHVDADGDVRATITGEELLDIDTDDLVIVDPTAGEADG